MNKFQAQHPYNFSRMVLQEFGDAFMRIQTLPKRDRPKPDPSLKKKPQGPKYAYKDGEPSVSTMAENPNKVTYGEWDHQTLKSSAMSDIQSIRSQSTIKTSHTSYTSFTNSTSTHYNDYGHMLFPQQQQQQPNHNLTTWFGAGGGHQPNTFNKRKHKKKRKNNDLRVGDEVLHQGTKYEIRAKLDDGQILIQNDYGSRYLASSRWNELTLIQ